MQVLVWSRWGTIEVHHVSESKKRSTQRTFRRLKTMVEDCVYPWKYQPATDALRKVRTIPELVGFVNDYVNYGDGRGEFEIFEIQSVKGGSSGGTKRKAKEGLSGDAKTA